MKRAVRHIVLLSVLLLTAVVGCSRGPKIIPEKEFGALYADLLLTDQWINNHLIERRKADTTLVYASVLEKHGYSNEQVVASMKYYLQDPVRYKRAMEVAVSRIERRYNELDAEVEAQRHIREFLRKYRKTDTVWTRSVTEPWVFTLPDPALYNVFRDTL